VSRSQSAAGKHRFLSGTTLQALSVRNLVVSLTVAAAVALAIVASVSALGTNAVKTDTGRTALLVRQQMLAARANQDWLNDDDQSNMFVSLIAPRDPSQAPLARTTWSQATAGYAAAQQDLRALRATGPTSAVRTTLDDAVLALGRYNGYSTAMHAAAEAGSVADAVRIQSVGNSAASNELATDLVRLDDLIRNQTDTSLSHVTSRASSASTTVIIVGVVALLALAGIGFVTIRILVARLRRATDRVSQMEGAVQNNLLPAIEALAGGDLTRQLHSTTEPITDFPAGEIGLMLRSTEQLRTGLLSCYDAYNRGVTGLQEMIRTVCGTASSLCQSSRAMFTNSEETGRAAEEVALAIGDVAKGSERQVIMVSQARQLAEEVASQVAEAERGAHATADAAGQARQLASDGLTAAAQASDAMRSVRDSSAAITSAIGELLTMSTQIGHIVETITTIAEQTNLLALNAAIEAARAGDQGRGFAVVADEVRNLAEESQHAAQEISQLVTSIQSETERVVGVVHEGAERTEEGASVVENTRQSFTAIGMSVEDITTQIEQIASLSVAVSANVRTLHQTVDEIATVAESSSATTEEVSASTEQTSAAAQEITTSAQGLATTAKQLNELIAEFQFTRGIAAEL
jgi:methyl-accepting chemotaxis protein